MSGTTVVPIGWRGKTRLAILVGAGLPTVSLVAVTLALLSSSFALTNPRGYVHTPGRGALPDDRTGTNPTHDAGLAYSDVSFPTVEGATLRGWLVPAPAAAAAAAASGHALGLVAVHGRGMDRRAFLPHLRMFRDLDATSLLFDLREHGLSDGNQRGMSMGYREAQDIGAAVRFLNHQGYDQVVVIGMSLGAGSAILAAANDPAIKGVVAESPYTSMEDYIQQMSDQNGRLTRFPALRSLTSRWPDLVVGLTRLRIGLPRLVAPIDVVNTIAPRPLLLVHGLADTAFVPEHSRRLFSRALDPKELWLVDGAEHTRVYQAAPEEYQRRLATVLQQVAAGAREK